MRQPPHSNPHFKSYFNSYSNSHSRLRHAAVALLSLLSAAHALASEVGWRQLSLAGAVPNDAPTVVAIYYPTQATARQIAMGPFSVSAAVQGPPDASFKGLIVLSHGTGGSELGHSTLAQALAHHGYLVAALRHPGDNWQDRSLLQTSAANYFAQRPQQASRVIDALLREPAWADRIAKDAKGPRIGVLGHSAGGYTALALAGAQPDPARVEAHCNSHRTDDPVFCSVGITAPPESTAPPPTQAISKMPALADARVRAVVAMAPVGVVFSAESLSNIRIPTALYDAEFDRFLVPRFHADWIARHLPAAQRRTVKNAWHFAFMDAPSMPIASEDGDIGANPPGFDRQAFLNQLSRELTDFFDKALR